LEQKEITNLPAGITLNQLLENGKKIQGNNWFNYSAYNNNCQDFIIAVLKGSNIGNEQDYNFVKQDTKSLFKGDSFLRKFANTVTDIGAKVNEITTGAGIVSTKVQSVLFDKSHWTKRKAINWLKKHNYTGLECHETENKLRFRQLEPSKKYKYITQEIPNNIELIIITKSNINNNNNNNSIINNNSEMPTIRKTLKYSNMSDSESDSDSDSDSECSMRGNGLARERQIIKKIKKLRNEIDEHQQVHGGKINIGRAFKKLGSTIKRGFNKEVMPTLSREVLNPAEKYITSKKGGLATDVIKYGLPAASSALLGGLATAATGGNPVAGVAASALGSKLGSLAGTELQKATGTSISRAVKRGKTVASEDISEAKALKDGKQVTTKGDLIHIDIASHDDSPMKGDGIKKKRGRPRKTSLEQIIENHREKEMKELKQAVGVMAKNINKEMSITIPPKHSAPIGSGIKLVKGSEEAKEHMAKLRAMRKK
jgi:hypothetical protein